MKSIGKGSALKRCVENQEQLYDHHGQLVIVENMRWRLNSISAGRHATLNWSLYAPVTKEIAGALVDYMRFQVSTKSENHCMGAFGALRILTKTAQRYVEGGMRRFLLGALADLRARGWEWRFHYVRDWYRWCSDQQLPGFDDDELLYELIQLRIPGNRKGEAVRSEDPEEGPLDEIEEAALRAALHRDDGPLTERALAWSFLALGCNSKNLVHLCEGDLKVIKGKNAAFYSLDVPRIKKRQDPRAEFKTRKLDRFLAELFERLIERNRELDIPEGYRRPLFARETPRPDCAAGSSLEQHAYHFTSTDLGIILRRIATRLNVISHRTGEPLRLTPRRLRYTFATRKVQEGCSMEALAELLDHTDLQNVIVYYSGQGLAKRLDEALAVSIGPLVNRFMGRVVAGEAEAFNGGGPIKAQPMGQVANIGTCGSTTLCKLYPPASCYICPKFQPWRDAPHREVLEDLIRQRDARIDLTGRQDDRIAKQFDEMILAVGQVVALCEEGA